MNFKKLLEGKRYGFFVTLAVVLLTLITGIVYTACYASLPREFNLVASLLLFFGFGISLVFVLTNKVKFLPYILGIINLSALLFYINGIYLYVSEVFVGIDSELTPSFIVTTLFYTLTFITNIVTIFLPQVVVKESKVEVKKATKILSTTSKAFLVGATSIFGVVVTGAQIARANKTAISNELNQPLFKIEGLDKEAQYYKSNFTNVKDLVDAGKDLAKEIVGEGAVLLQNKDNALPLKNEKKITLYGYAGAHPSYSGRGSSNSRTAQKQTKLYDALKEVGFDLNEKVYQYYYDLVKLGAANALQRYDAPFIKSEAMATIPTIGDNPEFINTFEEYGDAAIYMITRSSGENSDIPNEEGNNLLLLSDNEKSILNGLNNLKKEGKIKKVILILNCCNQIQQNEFLPYDIDATLWVGNPGITGFSAVAEILKGTINPSGHLPDTFWYDHKLNPVMNNFGAFKYENADSYNGQINIGSSKPNGYVSYMAYQEGVYVGYRYAETRYTDFAQRRENVGQFDYDKTIYRPFGYGESYTTFETSNFAVNYDNETKLYKVSANVKNTGDVAGKFTAQVYLQKPYGAIDIERKIEKPAVELVGFEKTKLLNPQETTKVEVTIDEAQFAVFDREVDKTNIITEGEYLLTLADNSHEAAKNFLQYNKVDVGGNLNLVYGKKLNYDKETYSVSKATNNKITNLFDEADINKLSVRGDNSLEFISRNNWNKKLSNKLSLNAEMVAKINSQQVSGNITPDDGEYPVYGEDKGMLLIDLLKDDSGNLISYNDPKWDEFLNQLTWSETVDLVRNGLAQTAASLKYGKPRTIDGNGPVGLTYQYTKGSGLAVLNDDPDKDQTCPNYPSIPVLAATFNKELATKFGAMVGEDSLWSGVNGLYGVGMNTHRSPYSGRNWEYYSEDPLLSGLMSAYQTKALQSKGCMVYVKHIALNDQEAQRFGIGIWSNEQALREISLKPFEIAVKFGGAMDAMTSLTRFGLEFAPACKALCTDFLRGECGMRGLMVTDMYTLGYLETSMPGFLAAGCDIPDGELDSSFYDVYRTEHSKFAHQMRESAKRVFYHTLNSNAMNGFTKDTKVVMLIPAWEQALNVGEYVTYSVFALSLVFAGTMILLNLKSKKEDK